MRVWLGMAALVFLVAAPHLPAAAQEKNNEADQPDLALVSDEDELMDEFALLAEEDIVFSAAKHMQEINESPSAISVITREQIENTHCTDVICLLRQLPEVDIRRVTPGFTVVGARAMTEDFGNKTLVLVDGRQVVNETYGVTLWTGLPIHLEDIERIEVIRGPGSALYGANAHSMVASITTRKPEGSCAEAFIGNGEMDRSSLHLRLGLPFGKFRMDFSGGLDTQGAWRIRDRRDRDVLRTVLRITHQTQQQESFIQAGLVHPEGLMYTQLAPANAVGTMMYHVFLAHRTEFLKAQISWSRIEEGWELHLPLEWGPTKLGDIPKRINFNSSNLDTDVQLNWIPFEGNLLIAGANYRWFFVESDDLVPNVTHQHRIGAFIHDEHRLTRNLVVTAGIRFDYNTITPFAFSPRVAAVWQFVDNNFLRLAYGQAFRKPSFYEASMHISTVRGTEAFPNLGEFFKRSVGNDKLGNEKTTTLEAGYRVHVLDRDLTVEADVFYTQFRNTISFQLDMKTDEFGLPDLGTSAMQFKNTGREADSVGGSVSATYSMSSWRLSANYTFRHSWYISEPPGGPSPTEGSKGERVPWEPAHLVNLSFSYIPRTGPRLGMSLHGHSSCELAWPEGGSIFGEDIPVHSPAAYFISGFLAWRLDIGSIRAELGIRVFNLLNAGFRDLPAVLRTDGSELGGQLLGRRIFFFFRGAI